MVLARVENTRRRRTPSSPKSSTVAGVWFLVFSVTFSFLSKQRMCMYIGAGYKAED